MVSREHTEEAVVTKLAQRNEGLTELLCTQLWWWIHRSTNVSISIEWFTKNNEFYHLKKGKINGKAGIQKQSQSSNVLDWNGDTSAKMTTNVTEYLLLPSADQCGWRVDAEWYYLHLPANRDAFFCVRFCMSYSPTAFPSHLHFLMYSIGTTEESHSLPLIHLEVLLAGFISVCAAHSQAELIL